MRIFDHLYARYPSKKIMEAKKKPAVKKGAKSSRGHLRPDSSWVAHHFGDGQKSRRLQYFHRAWTA